MALYNFRWYVVTYGPIFGQREQPLCSTMTTSGSNSCTFLLTRFSVSEKELPELNAITQLNWTPVAHLLLVRVIGTTGESKSRSLEWNVDEECGW
jgi:hypothetical protein